jgi:hypothetical protein
MCLLAVLTEQVGDLPAIMREVLLTLARQALLSRHVLVPSEYLEHEDRSTAICLAAATLPHGGGAVAHGLAFALALRWVHIRLTKPLAWGETGEGR